MKVVKPSSSFIKTSATHSMSVDGNFESKANIQQHFRTITPALKVTQLNTSESLTNF